MGVARPEFPARLGNMSFQWYVLHVKPHKEPAVYDLLGSNDIKAYYPNLKVKPVNPRSRKERPFFPGYMFVNVDLKITGADTLRWTEGTYGLVKFGAEPTSVPEYLVTELKERLKKYETSGIPGESDFIKGDHVRIVNGLFEGYDAIFDAHISGKDRVQVLLAYLNDQPKKLVLEPWNISKTRRRR